MAAWISIVSAGIPALENNRKDRAFPAVIFPRGARRTALTTRSSGAHQFPLMSSMESSSMESP